MRLLEIHYRGSVVRGRHTSLLTRDRLSQISRTKDPPKGPDAADQEHEYDDKAPESARG
jgi:hypothetical protein